MACLAHKPAELIVLAMHDWRINQPRDYQPLKVWDYVLQDLSKSTTYELQLVNVRCGSSSIIVANIYRPPSLSLSAIFFDEIADLLTNVLATTGRNILLTGDLNCPGKDLNSIDIRLTTVLELFCMVQAVNEPTRGNSLLDNSS